MHTSSDLQIQMKTHERKAFGYSLSLSNLVPGSIQTNARCEINTGASESRRIQVVAVINLARIVQSLHVYVSRMVADLVVVRKGTRVLVGSILVQIVSCDGA